MSLSLVKDAALGATLPVHPAAEIFPPMSEAEFNALVVDILANGLRDPIVLCDGAILDGRHRARACAQAGVALKTVEWDRAGTAEAFVVSRNLHRRHLNESQRAMVAAKIATLEHGQRKTGKFAGHATQSDAASLLNVSERLVRGAAAIHKHGTAAEIAAVERGEAAVSAVARQIKHRTREAPMDAAAAPAAPAPTTDPVSAVVGGGRVTVPPGTTLEQLCREAMAREAAGNSPSGAAADTGLSLGTYRQLRDIVLLVDRTDLTAKQQAVARAALAHANEHRQPGPAHAMVADLVARIWGRVDQRRAKGRDRAEARRRDAWEHAVGVIAQSCAAFAEIDLPHLPADQARRDAATINRAIDTLRRIGREIVEINT